MNDGRRRGTWKPPKTMLVPQAVYQGLGALPSYQTEDVLYQTVANAGALSLEQWTWDAGTYTWCNSSSVCNGTDVVDGKCCDHQGAWEPQQGDYMPQATRFPEHGPTLGSDSSPPAPRPRKLLTWVAVDLGWGVPWASLSHSPWKWGERCLRTLTRSGGDCERRLYGDAESDRPCGGLQRRPP